MKIKKQHCKNMSLKQRGWLGPWESLYSPLQVDGSWSHKQLEKHVHSRPSVSGVEVAQTNPNRAVSHVERAGFCLYTPVNYPIQNELGV